MQLKTLSLASVAIAAIAAAPTSAAAQACPAGKCNIAPSNSSLIVGGTPGYQTQVWISVLGGASSAATQLFRLLSPFNPGNGEFTPGHALANKVAIGPAKPVTGSNWVAPTNSTYLGLFNPGDEIYLGILTRGSQWFFSGPSSRVYGQKPMMNQFGSSPVYRDDRSTVMGGTGGGDVYGFEDWKGGNSDRDFNDFVFSVNQSTVTPEPASMLLLGTGLAGIAGIARRRMKRRDEA